MTPSYRAWLATASTLLALSTLGGACTQILGNDFIIVVEDDGGGGAGATGGGGGANGGSGGASLCQNGMLDPGETCDGDCPVECIDPDLCTTDIMMGSPDSCDVMCSHEPTVTCKPNDGCCPMGCFQGNDNDCALNVLVLGSGNANSIGEIQGMLQNSGEFMVVDTFDAESMVPTESVLGGYHAVLVFSFLQFGNPAAVGNRLANFHDAGGRVVVANGANCNNFGIAGRFVDEGYLLMAQGDVNPNSDDLQLLETNSPLLVGVNAATAGVHCDGAAAPGATVVARYATSGDPAIIRGEVAGRKRTDLNMLPISGTLSGDRVAIVVNAIKYQ